MTKTRKRLHLITEDVEGHGRVTYFPVRLGSACTVQKVQGVTLDHISIWLDVPGCRAEAYVTLSCTVRHGLPHRCGRLPAPRHPCHVNAFVSKRSFISELKSHAVRCRLIEETHTTITFCFCSVCIACCSIFVLDGVGGTGWGHHLRKARR